MTAIAWPARQIPLLTLVDEGLPRLPVGAPLEEGDQETATIGDHRLWDYSGGGCACAAFVTH